MKIQLSGWGNYPVAECEVRRIYNLSTVKNFVLKNDNLITRGLGRSYADQSLNSSGIVLENGLNRLLDFDERNGILHAESGLSFYDILKIFLKKGYFPSVTPGTKFVTLGGAVASDVHGKNHHKEGSISEHISEITLMLADGSIKKLNPDMDLFWATFSGMGLTGVVLDVKFRLKKVETSYIRFKSVRVKDLDELMAVITENDKNFTYTVAWVDSLAKGKSLGRGVGMFGEHAKLEELPDKLKREPLKFVERRTLSIPFYFPSFLLNDLTIGLFNEAYYITHGTYEGIIDYEKFFYPLDSINHWNRAYGKRGFVQFQFVVPEDKTLIELFESIVKHGGGSFLAVLKRMGNQKGYFAFGMEGWTFALDFPVKSGLFEFLRKLSRKIADKGGRIYLTKDAILEPDVFRDMYPEWRDWKSIKESVDPSNKFQSDFSRRLGL